MTKRSSHHPGYITSPDEISRIENGDFIEKRTNGVGISNIFYKTKNGLFRVITGDGEKYALKAEGL